MKRGQSSANAKNAPFQSVYDAKAVGSRIRRCRELRGLTQEAAAELIGRSLRFYADIERGASGMSVDTLLAISALYETTPDALLLAQEPVMTVTHQQELLNRLFSLDDREKKYALSLLELFLDAVSPSE